MNTQMGEGMGGASSMCAKTKGRKYQLDVTPAITFEMNKEAEMAMKALAYFT